MNGEDQLQIAALAGYIEHTCGIHKSLIRAEHRILLYDNKVIGIFSKITDNICRRTTTLNPDIIILNKSRRKIRLVIELDGSAHDRPHIDRGRTRRRNMLYKMARIPFVVINIREFRRHRKSWFDFIDRKLVSNNTH